MSTTTTSAPTTAWTLAPLLSRLLGDPLPIRIRAWDGSEAGPADAPTVTVASRRALRRLLWSPGELGLAEAYITGEIDVEGDLGEGLRRIRQASRERGARPSLRPAQRVQALAAALRLGALGPRPAPPAGRAALHGGLHSRARDRAAVSHHYDLSNEFYALLLDPTMAYSCAYFSSEQTTLAQAQRAKLDLICRKLGLTSGMRLLDVGCGWGSLALHAAEHYRVEVTAVTLSERQHASLSARADAAGLSGRVTVRLRDYREINDGPYDAISAVEMGEHVGDTQYPAFARRLYRLLRPQGRLLVQQMSRGSRAPGGGAFIETYIAPDMHMRPVGATVTLLEETGLEVRQVEALREHYSRTVDAWRDILELRWDAFTDLVGEESARVWRLYLAGASLAFRERRMGVDQLLAVRPGADGTSGIPAIPHAWYPAS